jgi:hypothetical protein
MKRLLTRTVLLACVLAVSASAAFVNVASANYLAGASLTCTSATYNFSTFPGGTQSVLETIYVDGAIVKQTTFDFTGPTGTNTVQYSVPNDGAAHYIEAYAYSITNGTPVSPSPAGLGTMTCGSPPPPPPGVCTFTQGYYKNHATATAGVIAGMSGATIQVGSMKLTAAQAQLVLTGGSVVNSIANPNLVLVLARQLISAELNVARGSTASAAVQAAIASANAVITTTIAGGQVQLSTGAQTNGQLSALNNPLDGFNSASDC